MTDSIINGPITNGPTTIGPPDFRPATLALEGGRLRVGYPFVPVEP